MKKIGFIFFTLVFMGCEKYVQISEPSVAGKWLFYDYDISIVNSPSDIKIVQDDTICINNFGLQKQIGEFIYMKQDQDFSFFVVFFCRNCSNKCSFNNYFFPSFVFFFCRNLTQQMFVQ